MPGCKQVLTPYLSATGTAAHYMTLTTGQAHTSVSVAAEPWMVTGSFRNLSVAVATAPGAGKSWIFTLYVDGIATALTATIADANTSASDITNVVHVTAGQKVNIVRTSSGTPTGVISDVSVEFNGATAGESAYTGGASHTTASATAVNFCQPFGMGGWATAGSTSRFNVIPTAGAMTSYRCDVATAPAAGQSWVLAWVKNDVVQDGAGGTVDTRATLGEAATSVTWAGSLPLVAGDRVRLQATPTGTPVNQAINIGIKFVATTDGESIIAAATTQAIPTSGTQYTHPTRSNDSWSTVEADRRNRAGISSFVLRSLYVRVNAASGSGDTRTFTTRKNAAATAQACAITGTSALDGNDVTYTVTLANGDTFSLECAYSGGGTAATSTASGWGWTQYATSSYVAAGGDGKGGKGGGGGKGGPGGKSVFGPSLYVTLDTLTVYGAN